MEIDHTYDALLGIPSPPMTLLDILLVCTSSVICIGAVILVVYFLRYQVPKLEHRRKTMKGY